MYWVFLEQFWNKVFIEKIMEIKNYCKTKYSNKRVTSENEKNT